MDRLYVGVYTRGDGAPNNGVCSVAFDGARGEARVLCCERSLENPSYLAFADGALYAVEENPGRARIAAYAIGGAGALTLRAAVPAEGSGMCHVAVCGDFLYGSNYLGGSLTGCRRTPDGGVGEACCTVAHAGRGADPARQEAPHVHSALPTPDGRRLVVADLGLDRLYQYEIDRRTGALRPCAAQPYAQVDAGEGPRHFAFHPNGRWLYLVTELQNNVIRFDWDAERLRPREKRTLTEGGATGPSWAADVHVTADGRFLYASVRGSDVIVGFAVDARTGALTPAGVWPAWGRVPRSFAVSPDGRFLAIAHQDSDTVVFCPRDPVSGRVDPPAASLPVAGAACVLWP